jgi:hypothetical protein
MAPKNQVMQLLKQARSRPAMFWGTSKDEYSFMKSDAYGVTIDEWNAAGLAHLLKQGRHK